jgi:hypothetical protein
MAMLMFPPTYPLVSGGSAVIRLLLFLIITLFAGAILCFAEADRQLE